MSWLVRRWVASRTDISEKAQEQYAWAIPHIEDGLGAIPLATLDREDVARWIEALAAGGELSKRSVQICRTVLRAALSEAVDEGLIPRSPAARVGLPRTVAKPAKNKDTVAWTEQQVDRFLAATADHRWAIAFRLGVLYGLRRSEVLALRWDDLDTKANTLRIDESLVATNQAGAWGNTKNERSRTTIPIDAAPSKPPNASPPAPDGKTTTWSSPPARGSSCSPAPTTEPWQRASTSAGLPRLTSHGLRHTAATQMVQSSRTRQPGTTVQIRDLESGGESPTWKAGVGRLGT